ncbi:6588_t:CDS:10, partial [Ambispora gerdemannii]
ETNQLQFAPVSGEPPQEPVISKKSGHVFEKDLILKYIAANGKDPVTGEEITEEDLLELKIGPKTVKPRPATLTSIPSLLSTFQKEWDSLMLETYTIKQQNQQLRQELSHALYMHDAACRVIARLIKERDAAREELANVQTHIGVSPLTDAAAPEPQPMEIENEGAKGISEKVIEKLDETSKELSKGRKKRKPPQNLTGLDEIRNFTQIFQIPSLHKTTRPGINCLDLDTTEQFVLTGGNDKIVHVYHKEENKVVDSLKGHTKKITDVMWHGRESGDLDIVFSASADKTVKIWRPSDNGYSESKSINVHTHEVTGIAMHATRDYFVSVSLDSSWAFHDIETGNNLIKVESNDVQKGYSAVEFHPDGLILGTGTKDSVVRIWDIKSQSNVASFHGHSGRITSLSFSENGYHLVTASEDNLVKLWDLRKLNNFKTITLPDTVKSINKVIWDFSGQYLAVGSTDLRIFQAKTWNELAVITGTPGEIFDLKFGGLAKFIMIGGSDRSLRVYVIDFYLIKRYFRENATKKRKSLLPRLSLKLDLDEKPPLIIGFFHPYCNAGGGGERVLWTTIYNIQQQERYKNVACIVYTGDTDVTKSEILDKVKLRFNISLNPDALAFVYLYKRHWIEDSRYPRFTLLCQSIASIFLCWEALTNLVPDIFFDTMGYAFTYPLVKLIGGIKVAAYVHYPTISSDMLKKVQERRPAFNNNQRITSSIVFSYGKLIYYYAFAYLYGLSGGLFTDIVMVNSSWTKNHIDQIWRIDSRVVYPPCDTDELVARIKFENEELARERVVENVLFEINAPFSKLVDWLSCGLIGIHTMWNEHFGIGVVEYMAAGLITIAHNSGGPKMDIVVDHNGSKTGFLATDPQTYADALYTIFTLSQNEYNTIRVNARNHVVNKFSVNMFDENVSDLLRELLV